MTVVLERINDLALMLFGEEAALVMFPDLCKTLRARRGR